VRYDVGILLGARWNVGILYALPEIATEPFARFRRGREELREAYRRFTAFAPDGGDVAGDLVLGLVESVIGMRRDLRSLPPAESLGDTVVTASELIKACLMAGA